MVTLVCATTAPDGSRTVPRIDPKVDCGIAALAPSRISAVVAARKRSPESLNPLSKNRRLVIVMSLLLDCWIENLWNLSACRGTPQQTPLRSRNAGDRATQRAQ